MLDGGLHLARVSAPTSLSRRLSTFDRVIGVAPDARATSLRVMVAICRGFASAAMPASADQAAAGHGREAYGHRA
jgi:hypothetical protein